MQKIHIKGAGTTCLWETETKREGLFLLLRSIEPFDSCLRLSPLEHIYWEVLLRSTLVDKTQVKGKGAIRIRQLRWRWQGAGKVWRASRSDTSTGNMSVLVLQELGNSVLGSFNFAF